MTEDLMAKKKPGKKTTKANASKAQPKKKLRGSKKKYAVGLNEEE